MMQCRDIDELMVDYLYQELDEDRAAELRAHVDGCARCGAEIATLTRMRRALHEIPEAEPSPALTSRLLHEAARRAPRSDGRGVWAWFTGLVTPVMHHPAWAAAATLLIVAGVAGFLSLKRGAPVSPAHEVASAPEPKYSAPPEPAAAREPAAPPATTTPEAAATGEGAQAHAATPADRAFELKRAEPPSGRADKAGARTAQAERDDSVLAPGGDEIANQAPIKETPREPEGYRGRASTAEPARVAEKPKPKNSADTLKQYLADEDRAVARGGAAAGAAAPAAPQPSPPPAATPAAPRPSSAAYGKASEQPPAEMETVAAEPTRPAYGTQKQANKAPVPQKAAQGQSLYRDARTKASGGQCDQALTILNRLQKVDGKLYKQVISSDQLLAGCRNLRSKMRKAAPPAATAPAEQKQDGEANEAQH